MQRPPMTPSDFEDNGPPRACRSRSCAASLTDWLVGARQGARAGIPPPQRQGEARRRQLHRRQLPAGRDRHRRRGRRAISKRTRTTSRFPEKRKIRYLLLDVEAIRAKIGGAGRRTSSAPTTAASSSTRRRNRCAPAASCSRPKARTTRRSKAKAEDAAQAGEGRRRLRGAGEEEFARTRRARRTAATSTTSAAAAWCPSSMQWRSRCSRARSATSREDAVRLPHHQGWSTRRPRSDAVAGRSASAAERSARLPSARRRRPRTWRRRCEAGDQAPSDLDKVAKAARAHRCRSPASSRATSRSSARAVAGARRAQAFDMKPGDVAGPLQRVARVRRSRRWSRSRIRLRAEGRRSEGPRPRRSGQAERRASSELRRRRSVAAQAERRRPTSRRRPRPPASRAKTDRADHARLADS